MVLPSSFLLNRACLEQSRSDEAEDLTDEERFKIQINRKILQVKNYAPDISHLLIEPVRLIANLSFLDTLVSDTPFESPQRRGSDAHPRDSVGQMIIDDDDSMDEYDEGSEDVEDDAAFP